MIALLQRVSEAAVLVNENVADETGIQSRDGTDVVVSQIGAGMLAFVAVEKGDGPSQANRLLQRLLAWRMFSDAKGRMNLNLAQAGGGLLLVPQFTLAADTDSGNRPSFTPAAPPEEGEQMFNLLVERAREAYPVVAAGIFGAEMKVHLVNDGPATFWLQV